jgi:hypothetical protein
MEKDFHYYLVYSLASITGYQKSATTIAYASQFVDDNNEGQFAIDGEEVSFPDKIKAQDGYYYPIMTQSLSIKSLDMYVQKYVYLPFHFLPGDNSVIIKGNRNKLNTTPNSANGRSLVNRALESNNPYQIGMALHTFADTWSHQNFTGLYEDWNKVYAWYEIYKNLVPSIGHADAGHSPDVISETWTDYRLDKDIQKIDNKPRALDATGEIFNLLRGKSQTGPQWSDVEKDYAVIINAPGYDERIKAISDFVADKGFGAIPNYQKDDWIEAALNKNGTDIVMKPDFITTHWYNFHQAAKAQFAYVSDMVKGF